MTSRSERLARWRNFLKTMAVVVFALLAVGTCQPLHAGTRALQAKPGSSANCRTESIDYKGWKAEKISNRWVQLVFFRKMAGALCR